jgi:hypothetical protein
MGLILTTLPVSEAAVEHIFFHVRDLFGQHSRAMTSELLEARVVAKLNSFHEQDSESELPMPLISKHDVPLPMITRGGQQPMDSGGSHTIPN